MRRSRASSAFASGVRLLAVGAIAVASGGALGAPGAQVAPVETANIWIDTNGGSCTRATAARPYADASACSGTAAAYAAASSGDTIIVRAGTYGRQVIPEGTKTVTIRRSRGTSPVFGTTRIDADHVRLIGFKIQRNDDPAPFVATLEVNGADNVLDQVHVDSRFMVDSVNGRQGINNSGDRNKFLNGSTYNVADDKGALIGGTGVVFDNFDFHDVRASHELVHNECAYSLAPNLTIRNSHFWNCATMDLFIERGSWFNQPLYCCVTIENNVFEHPTQVSPSSWHHYSLGVHGGDVQEMRNWRVVNNTFETTAGADLPAPGTIWANNIGAWSCNPGATYSNNVGTRCSASDIAVTPSTSCGPPSCRSVVTAPFGWVDPAAHDFRLKARSPAMNRGSSQYAPPTDQDGYRRPFGARPDAGAFEAGTGLVIVGDRRGVGPFRQALARFEKAHASNATVAFHATGPSGPGGVVALRGTSFVRQLRDVDVVVVGSAGSLQAGTRFLQQALGRPSPRPRIVVVQRTPRDCHAGAATLLPKEWSRLLNRYRVRLVIGNDGESYRRFGSGRVIYLVAGTGASPSMTQACTARLPRPRVDRKARTFLYIGADASGILGRAVDLNGKVIDSFRLRP